MTTRLEPLVAGGACLVAALGLWALTPGARAVVDHVSVVRAAAPAATQQLGPAIGMGDVAGDGLLVATPRLQVVEAGTSAFARLRADPALVDLLPDGTIRVRALVQPLLDGVEVVVADVEVTDLARLATVPQPVQAYGELPCAADLARITWVVEGVLGTVAYDVTDVVGPPCTGPDVVEAPPSVDATRPRWSDTRRRPPWQRRRVAQPTPTPSTAPSDASGGAVPSAPAPVTPADPGTQGGTATGGAPPAEAPPEG